MVGTISEDVSIRARTGDLWSNCGDGSMKLVSMNMTTTEDAEHKKGRESLPHPFFNWRQAFRLANKRGF